MGDGTRGEEGNLWIEEVEGVVCRLCGWVGRLGTEVSKEVRDDWCPLTRNLYYFKKY